MPLATGRISWRANSSNKTYSGLLNAIRNFLVNSGNYTVISDQISASNYFVVQSTRDTGFVGDRIIARVGISTWSFATTRPYLYIEPWESWSGTTGTNGQTTNIINSNNSNDNSAFSLTNDCDIWISCDTTFLLSMSEDSIETSGTFTYKSVPNGVCCFERLPGDNDPGTFYGRFRLDSWSDGSYVFYVPRRFDGATGTSAVFSLETSFGRLRGGNGRALLGLNEMGRHYVFEFNAYATSVGRRKGKLFGPAVSTYSLDLGLGQLIPNATNPQYIVGKSDRYSILMQVASTITPITT